MPNPGGLFQQHPSHVKLLSTVYAAKTKWEEDKLKQQEQKNKDLPDPGDD